MRGVLTTVALLLTLGGGMASAAWVVNEHGDCERAWSGDSLLRGPTAIVNAPLVPFRSAVGGALLAGEDPAAGGVQRAVILGPALTVGGLAMGMVEAGIWLVGGLADTLTGGYFAIAPEEATYLEVTALRPLFVNDARRRTVPAEPCGKGVPLRR